MMRENKIRVLIPFLIVFGGSYFIADADIFHNFGTRFDFVQYNIKLIWLLFVGDAGQVVVCTGCSLIFFKAWRKNRRKNIWYSDLHWQLGGTFACWAILAALSIVSNFFSYLWIQGMIRLCVFLTVFYLLNTLYRIRKILWYPETREESLKKAEKFDELIDLINKQHGK